MSQRPVYCGTCGKVQSPGAYHYCESNAPTVCHQHSNPEPCGECDGRDCDHGHLARSCELCELRQRAERAEATIVKLRAEVAEMGNVDDLLGKSCDFHAERAERAEDEVARLRAVIDRIESQAVCIGMGEDAEMLARIAEWAHTALGEE